MLPLNQRARRFGINDPRCGSCRDFYHETDGDYGEIDCGTYCLKHDPNMESETNHCASGLCQHWIPNFWETEFAASIGGENSDVVEATMNFAKAAYDRAVVFELGKV